MAPIAMSPIVSAAKTAMASKEVDVSATSNNCFFHAYAIYLLSNNLPLPQDLFTKAMPENQNPVSPAEKLKKTFTSPEDLKLFNRNNKQLHPSSPDKAMLFEKSIVLGVLLREWFAKELKSASGAKQVESIDAAIRQYQNLSEIMSSEEEISELMKLGNYGAIFEANAERFQQFKTKKPTDDECFAMYSRYVDHFAKPGNKVAQAEVADVLKKWNVSYKAYGKTGEVTNQFQAASSLTEASPTPVFEFMLDAAKGHYYLLSDKQQEPAFLEHRESLRQFQSLEDPAERARKIADILSVTSDPMIHSVTTPKKADPQTQALTAKEQAVFDKLTLSITNSAKGQAYKQTLKDFIMSYRNKTLGQSLEDPINAKDIDKATAKPGETDEQFAKRLQDAEFEAAGLGPRRPTG